MRRLLMLSLAVVLFVLQGRGAEAVPIQLLSIDGGATTGTTVGGVQGVGSVWMPEYLPLTLDYSSLGGSIQFSGGAINPNSAWNANSPQNYPADAQFAFNLAALAPGSTDQYQGPQIQISGEATGTLTGPGDGGSSWRWSGGYSGTASAVSLFPFGSQDISQLPAPLLDIYNHPDHFHVNVTVTGGDMNYLQVTLTFDPPSSVEAPEPSALMTLLAGATGLLIHRRRGRAGKDR